MKRSIIFLTFVFCILAVMPSYWSASAKDNWVSVRSKNFLLIGNAKEKDIRQVGVRLEQFRDVFSRLFKDLVISTPVPTTVVVFKSDSSYRPFKPQSNTAGYFQPGEDVNYITLTTELQGQQDPFSVIFHEYTHLLVANTLGSAPTWFSEGLAEYYSTFTMTDDQKFVLGRPIASHVYLLREKKHLPLRTLFQVNQKSPYYNERDKQSIFYAQSWALMHYLILGNNGQRVKQMSRFVELTSAGMPMEEAFDKAFATTFESMEKELKAYISRDRYPIVPGHFERKLEFDTAMEAAPITEAEAQAYLGDLLLHSNRSDAEAYLQKALALDPNLAMAHAALGMLRVRQGKDAEARQSLERAVSANSQNYLIHYYYAYALSRSANTQIVSGFSAETVASMRRHLNKAIELRPDFPESYRLLAYISVVSGTQVDESIEMIKRVSAKWPGRNDMLFMLAQLYLAKSEYKTGRELLEKLTAANVDEEVRKPAQSILKQLTAIEEEQASFRAALREREENSRTSTARSDVVSNQPSESAAAVDPASYLRDALRKPRPGELQVQGMLIRIDCDPRGITFVVQTGERLLRLRTAEFSNVDMTSFSADAGRQISCGPRKPANNIVLTYTPSADARNRTDGTPKSIEFVPNDFKLTP